MVIDIDSFLNNYDESDNQGVVNDDSVTNEGVDEVRRKSELEFQKDVEDKLLSKKKNVETGDITVLKQLYDEIKDFDEDLLNKFLGIEFESKDTLKELGNKYSDEFSKQNRSNAKIIQDKIVADLKLLDEKLKVEEFEKALEIFRGIIVNYNYFPRTYLKEKVQLSSLLRKREIEVYELINVHKKQKKTEIKHILNEKILALKKEIDKKNIKEIERISNDIQDVINSIPTIIVPILSDEKIKASKVLFAAENILVKEYDRIFTHKIGLLDNQFEKFHRSYLNKDLNGALLVYNEILLIFKSLPEVFLDRKVEVYKKINRTFGFLNKLIVSQNVFMFLESYEYSKKIEAMKEYLWHVSRTKKVSLERLHLLKEQIDGLPEKYYSEKNDLINYINPLLTMCRKKIEQDKQEEAEIECEKIRNMSILKEKIKAKDKEIINKINLENNESSDTKNDLKSDVEHDKKKKEINSTVNILKSIELNYKKFKNTTNPVEVKKLYKKLIFSLRTVPMASAKKKEILRRINKALCEKKIA